MKFPTLGLGTEKCRGGSGRRRRTNEERELDCGAGALGVKRHRHRGHRPERGQGMERKRRRVGVCRNANGAGARRTLRVGVSVRGFQPGKHQQKQDAHPGDPAAGFDLKSFDHWPLDVKMILAEPGHASRYPKGATLMNTEVTEDAVAASGGRPLASCFLPRWNYGWWLCGAWACPGCRDPSSVGCARRQDGPSLR